MSTFDGLLNEFPSIRIDHFRSNPNQSPPAACFLSHVHSDHLTGLESLKMPFVYCSAATKKILLRMEKYPHRMNFQKGILEARKQTYRHLKLVLRALPLQTPIELELGPKTAIRVTLFDANHCPGAVMFLIEGDGKAILYTGDIRAESWWVNSIMKNPVMLPYTYGTRRLDCVYLDTTFASHDDIYKEFPSKAEGLKELLTKVKNCPRGSRFYFRSWTLGYEDVWLALSTCLNSRVHVDDYQLGLFNAIADQQNDNGPALVGVQIGNQVHPGCLTSSQEAGIHSCEPGMECHTTFLTQPNTVWISPIISRSHDGTELAEIGAGGGGGDLYATPQLEIGNEGSIAALRMFCTSLSRDEIQFEKIKKVIESLTNLGEPHMSLEGLGLDLDQEVSLKDFIRVLSNQESAQLRHSKKRRFGERTKEQQQVIHFPYSRHSSYSELRHLISMLQPRDICPCTVDLEVWSEETSMKSLFGDLCSDSKFCHDQKTREKVAIFKNDTQDTRTKRKRPTDSESPLNPLQVRSCPKRSKGDPTSAMRTSTEAQGNENEGRHVSQKDADRNESLTTNNVRESLADVSDTDSDLSNMSVSFGAFNISARETNIRVPVGQQIRRANEEIVAENDDVATREQTKSRMRAYRAAKAYLNNGDTQQWSDLHLRSMGWKGHTEEEQVL